MRMQVITGFLIVAAASGCTRELARNSAVPAARPTLGSQPAVPPSVELAQQSSAWWYRSGAALARQRGAGAEKALNLILFVGDGMSLTTVAAARIFEGQKLGGSGEDHSLGFEIFPNTALSRTYNTDSQTPDSAGTMTAMMSGAKTRAGMLGVGAEARHGDCAGSLANPLPNLLELAESAGLSTGLVSTTRITHATPAATYAHVPDRDWEADSNMDASALAQGCHDIARQLVEFAGGDGIEVVMGGGRQKFLPLTVGDPEHPQLKGLRADGRNLILEWGRRHPLGQYAWNGAQFAALDLGGGPVLALFEPDHMQYEHERKRDPGAEPSLAEMTRASITMLARNRKGYFLMVEGGRIDHAHHAGNAYRALTDTLAFSDAVRAAAEATSATDTLIIVTADHSHTMAFAGYPERGNPILGKVREMGKDSTDALGLPYTTLSYANGPGYAGASEQQRHGPKRYPHILAAAQPANGRPDLSNVDTTDPDYLQEATLPLRSESHSGEDVGVWARGPGAAAVRGAIEQNVIFHLLLQAQPRIVKLLCERGQCEDGVPVLLPPAGLRRPATGQAR